MQLSEGMRPYFRDLEAAIDAALAGGRIVKDFYDRAAAATYEKRDGSPVTDADLAADRAIREVLGHHFPDDAILSEEGANDASRLERSRCWIVDPVDGTEQFIARTGEFDVLVALAEDGRPVAVAGYQPTTETLVTATKGGGTWVQIGNQRPERIEFAPSPAPLRLATSKWFGTPENEPILRSLAHQLGAPPAAALVTGFTPRMFLPPRAFDVMVGVRLGDDQTMASEWDFAVADLVINEAGGLVTDLEGKPFRYNKRDPVNLGGLIAAADLRIHARVVEALTRQRAAASNA